MVDIYNQYNAIASVEQTHFSLANSYVEASNIMMLTGLTVLTLYSASFGNTLTIKDCFSISKRNITSKDDKLLSTMSILSRTRTTNTSSVEIDEKTRNSDITIEDENWESIQEPRNMSLMLLIYMSLIVTPYIYRKNIQYKVLGGMKTIKEQYDKIHVDESWNNHTRNPEKKDNYKDTSITADDEEENGEMENDEHGESIQMENLQREPTEQRENTPTTERETVDPRKKTEIIMDRISADLYEVQINQDTNTDDTEEHSENGESESKEEKEEHDRTKDSIKIKIKRIGIVKNSFIKDTAAYAYTQINDIRKFHRKQLMSEICSLMITIKIIAICHFIYGRHYSEWCILKLISLFKKGSERKKNADPNYPNSIIFPEITESTSTIMREGQEEMIHGICLIPNNAVNADIAMTLAIILFTGATIVGLVICKTLYRKYRMKNQETTYHIWRFVSNLKNIFDTDTCNKIGEEMIKIRENCNCV